jgi:hypothetical protein
MSGRNPEHGVGGGVVCLVPRFEVINSEGRATSVVCSEVIVFSLRCRKSHVPVRSDVAKFQCFTFIFIFGF